MFIAKGHSGARKTKVRGITIVSLHQALYAYVQEVLFLFYKDRLLSASNWSDLFS